MKDKKVLLTPNQLSVIRICMIPLFCVFFYVGGIPNHYFWSAVIFFVATVTDFLDGYVARKYNMITDLGKFLDAIADKVLVLTAMTVMLTVDGMMAKFPYIAGVGVSIILARELIVSCFRMIAASKGLVIQADMIGKIKTNVQNVAVVALLVGFDFFGMTNVSNIIHIIGFVAFVLAVIMTVISGISYFVKNKQVLSKVDDQIKPKKTDTVTIPKHNEVEHAMSTTSMPVDYVYKTPSISLLEDNDNSKKSQDFSEFNKRISDTIVDVLKNRGIECKVENIVNGVTVSRFDISIPKDVPIKNIYAQEQELNLFLAQKGKIRIVQIPQSLYIGIEVPNDTRSTVNLKEIVSSDKFANAKKGSLTFALGKDIEGNSVCLDIVNMPHLLIAGATGTGKSVCLNGMLTSLIMKYSPDELRMIIVDPKTVELSSFAGIPHLLFNEIITSLDRALAMLSWAIKEMESRYQLLYNEQVYNIDEYNKKMATKRCKKMYRILIVVDEFSDLIYADKTDVQDKIKKLTLRARAVGIHLILATQRPSIDIIGGSIKTNITSRICFKAINFQDSYTVFGASGAEMLYGCGDLLYKTSSMTSAERVQGLFISQKEMNDVISYIKENNKCYYDNGALNEINKEVRNH